MSDASKIDPSNPLPSTSSPLSSSQEKVTKKAQPDYSSSISSSDQEATSSLKVGDNPQLAQPSTAAVNQDAKKVSSDMQLLDILGQFFYKTQGEFVVDQSQAMKEAGDAQTNFGEAILANFENSVLGKLGQLSNNIQQLEQQIQQLEQEGEQAQAQITQLNAQITQLKSDMASLQSQYDADQSQAQDIEKKLQDPDISPDEACELRYQLQQLQNAMQSIQSQLTSDSKTLADDQSQVTSLQSKIDTIHGQITADQTNLTGMKAQFATLFQEMLKLAQGMNGLLSQLKTTEQNVMNFQQAVKEALELSQKLNSFFGRTQEEKEAYLNAHGLIDRIYQAVRKIASNASLVDSKNLSAESIAAVGPHIVQAIQSALKEHEEQEKTRQRPVSG